MLRNRIKTHELALKLIHDDFGLGVTVEILDQIDHVIPLLPLLK